MRLRNQQFRCLGHEVRRPGWVAGGGGDRRKKGVSVADMKLVKE